MRWIVKQCQAYFSEGLIIPETIQILKTHYRRQCTKNDNTEIKQYIERNWVKDDNSETLMDDIVEQYKQDFPNDSLLSDSQIETKLTDGLKGLNIEKKRKDNTINGERVRYRFWKMKKL